MNAPNTTCEVDVLILGGGPAGTATAISLKRVRSSISVALVERSSYESARIGEAVPPAIRIALEQLGVWEKFYEQGHLPAHGVCSAWGARELSEHEFLYHPQRQGWHLDRVRFDRMLAREAAALGVRIRTGVDEIVFRVTGDGSWRFDLRSPDQTKTTVGARFVVDATGRQVWFARGQGARPVVIDRLIGFSRIYYFEPRCAPQNTYVMVESCEEGWWYSALLPGARMIVTLMTDVDLARRAGLKSPDAWRAVLDRTRHIKARLLHTGAIPAKTVKPWIARSQRLDVIVGPRWLAVGDAACAFDPLSAQGILKALNSGLFASYAIADFFRGVQRGLERYGTLVERDFDEYLEARAAFYGQEWRWPSSLFWKRRQEVISLDPETLLATGGGIRIATHELSSPDLSNSDLDFLASYCRVPRPAHQIVAALRARVRSSISDRRLILALQCLCETGSLAWTPLADAIPV